jgi:hypothetical protein
MTDRGGGGEPPPRKGECTMLQYQLHVIDRSCVSDQAPPRNSLIDAIEDASARVAERREFEVIDVIEYDTEADTERVVFSVQPRSWGVLCTGAILDTIVRIEEAGAVTD